MHTSYGPMLISLLLIGFGVSFTIPSLLAAVIAAVPKAQVGAVSGALNSSRQLGATLGVAILGSLLTDSHSLSDGVHMTFIITAVILFSGSLLSFVFIGTGKSL